MTDLELLELFRGGMDTRDIASYLWLRESEVANRLASLRDAVYAAKVRRQMESPDATHPRHSQERPAC